MRKMLYAAIFNMLSLSCYASDFVRYEKANGLESFVDISSIKRHGELRQFKAITNLDRPLNSISSTVHFHEIKCNERSVRFVKNVNYSEKFGVGRVRGYFDEKDLNERGFFPIGGDEGARRMFRIVCGQ